MKKRFLGPAGLLALWFVLTSFHLINPLFLPSPIEVFKKLYQLFISKEIFIDIGLTLYRLIFGFSLGVIIGIPIGIIMGYYKQIYQAFDLIIDFFRSIPVMSLFPLFLVFFGIGDGAKLCTAAWSSSLIILFNTMYGVINSKKTRLMVAKTMKATQYQILTKVIIPEALPEIFVGLRLGLSIALIVIVMSEMFMGTQVGLGQRIYNAALMYRIPEMYGAILLTGFLGYILNKGFEFSGNRVVHWTGK